ncbi:MAG: hypothetical protein ACI9S8_003064 [Chlamydiales bacterium]|jgi:hypothetical protein
MADENASLQDEFSNAMLEKMMSSVEEYVENNYVINPLQPMDAKNRSKQAVLKGSLEEIGKRMQNGIKILNEEWVKNKKVKDKKKKKKSP